MIINLLKGAFLALIFLAFTTISAKAQAVLIDHNFQTTTLPPGVTSDGVISPTKAADGVCSKGMIQVNSGGYLQVDVSSCGAFTVNMKSTSSSARAVTVKYKKEGEANYTVATTTLSVSTAASFDFGALYPNIKSSIPVSVRIEPTNGNIQIHDLFVRASASLSNAAEITEFKMPGQIGNEVINNSAATISINVLMGTPLTSVVPDVITTSPQATINPEKTVARNFTSAVNYTVTAQDGTTTKTWQVNVTQVASPAKDITSFKLANNQIGDAVINSTAATITVNMPVGSSLSNLTPIILSVSPNATISPAANTARDFGQPITYTVTAQDNSTKSWTITVNLVDPNAVVSNYEAEEAEYAGKVDNAHLNYTGSGFIDFLATGENAITFTVCQQQAGNQTAKLRYSLAKDDIRRGNLYVNDAFVKTLDFPRTATFDDWSEETATLSLLAGVNKIKVAWDTTDGPNLDRLSLSGAPCTSYTLTVSSTNSGKVTVTPTRPANKYFDGETVTLLVVKARKISAKKAPLSKFIIILTSVS